MYIYIYTYIFFQSITILIINYVILLIFNIRLFKNTKHNYFVALYNMYTNIIKAIKDCLWKLPQL